MPPGLQALLCTLACTHLAGASCLRHLVIMFGEISGIKIAPTSSENQASRCQKNRRAHNDRNKISREYSVR